MLPQQIAIEVHEGTKPCAGVLVNVTLVTTRKNDFRSMWGPTDAAGKLTVTRQELLDEGMKDREFFLMDYGHPELDFSGEIRLRVAREADLGRALAAYAQFSPGFPYRTGYAAMLQLGLDEWQSGPMRSPEISASADDTAVTLVIER